MKSLLQSKKGFTDNNFLVLYFLIFIGIGVTLPFINEAFSGSGNNFNVDGLEDTFENDATITQVTTGTLLLSVVKMGFWTFGALPWFLDALFTIFRIHFWIVIYRQFRSGSG